MRKLSMAVSLCALYTFSAQANAAASINAILDWLEQQHNNNQVDSKYEKMSQNIKNDIMESYEPNDHELNEFISKFDKTTSKFDDIDYDYYLDIVEKYKDNFTSAQKNESNKASRARSEHLNRLIELAYAYNSSKSLYFQSPEVLDIINGGVELWVTLDPQCLNWWWRMIGFPKRLSIIALLMQPQLQPQLTNRVSDYLLWSWNNGGRDQTGANLMDVMNITLKGAVFSKNEAVLTQTLKIVEDYFSKMTLYPNPENGQQRAAMEGLQVDYSYNQHSSYGRQLYLAHYGIDYFRAIVNFFLSTSGTTNTFNDEKTALLEEAFLISIPWIIFEGSFDENQTGRFIGREDVASYVDLYRKVIRLGTPRQSELQQTLDWIENGNSDSNYLGGNRSFWRGDYMVQRRQNYFTSVRMTSTRTTGNSSGNGMGLKNIHTSDNVNYIMTHGNEYSGLFYANDSWDWNRIPGTTAEQTPSSIPLVQPTWGKNGTGGTPFAGVVSDGENGASAVMFDKHGITANKSWFFFDEFYVALGSKINAPTTSYDIVTTLNQTNLNGTVTSVNVGQGQAVYHDSVGYYLPKDAIEKDQSNGIFNLGINHGLNPSDATYQYFVYPGVSLEQFRDSVVNDLDIYVDNQSNYQSVYDRESNVMYLVTYEPVRIKVEGRDIEVSAQSVLMIKDINTPEMEILAANPTAESLPVEPLKVTVDGVDYQVSYPDGLYAGKTTTAELMNH